MKESLWCPFKMANPDTVQAWTCEGSQCAWWEPYFGMCCMKVPAYLKGVEDERRQIRGTLRQADRGQR